MMDFIQRAYRALIAMLDQKFHAFFFYTIPRTGLTPEYRHYRHFRDVLWVLIKGLTIAPMVLLQFYYWTTVLGCSSLSWRNHLGSICVSSYPYASPVDQPVSWDADLWSGQEATDLNVRPPPQVSSLLNGYLHICDSELYLRDYFNEIEGLPTKVKTNDMYQDLSKCTLRISNPS